MSLTEENEKLRRKVLSMEQKIASLVSPMPEQERNEIAQAQARADAVARKFGDVGATQPLPHETGIQFRRRLAATFQKHSPTYRNSNLSMIVDPAAMKAAEETIYNDATQAALNPASYPPGTLRAITEPDPSGRPVVRWVGDSMSWRQHFMTGGQIGQINQTMVDRARYEDKR